MRVNFMMLAILMLVMAGVQALDGQYALAAAASAVTVMLLVMHFIRVRRFKRFDQARTFDDA